MREVVKNVKGRANECVKEQLYGGSRRWGRMVGVSRLQRKTSSLSSTDESVIKHHDTLEHTHTRTHIIPTFLPAPTRMSSSPLEI